MSSFVFETPVNMLLFDPSKFTAGSVNWVSSTKIVITGANGLTATLTGAGFVAGQPVGTITSGILKNGAQTILAASGLDITVAQLYADRSNEAALKKLLFSGDVTIRGSTGADVLVGGASGAGNDYLYGGAGADTLYGQGAVNYLDGGAGADKLVGQTGISYASYKDATAGVTVDLLDPTKNKGDATGDTYTNIHRVIGSNFNDVIIADNHGDTIVAGPGSDTIVGGAGADTVIAGAGKELITGGGGADALIGSLTGDDTYVYKSTSDSTVAAPDNISHWHAGDKINLSAIDANTAVAGHQTFKIGSNTKTPGTIVVTHNTKLTVTIVSLYTNASGVAASHIFLVGDLNLTASDFVLTAAPAAQSSAQLSRFTAAAAGLASGAGAAPVLFGETHQGAQTAAALLSPRSATAA